MTVEDVLLFFLWCIILALFLYSFNMNARMYEEGYERGLRDGLTIPIPEPLIRTCAYNYYVLNITPPNLKKGGMYGDK